MLIALCCVRLNASPLVFHQLWSAAYSLAIVQGPVITPSPSPSDSISYANAIFHFIGPTLKMYIQPPRNGVNRPRPIFPRCSLGCPTVCLPETKWVRRPTHQPIKWSSTEYLATFTRFQSHTRIIGKGNLFDFATISTRLTARSFTGKRGNL